jgi:hypothetical protein
MYEIEKQKHDGAYWHADCCYTDDFTVGGNLVFRRVCELSNSVVAALLDNHKLTNKGYVALWCEDQHEGLIVFGVYVHDDKNYLMKATMADLVEVSRDRFGFSERLMELIDRFR